MKDVVVSLKNVYDGPVKNCVKKCHDKLFGHLLYINFMLKVFLSRFYLQFRRMYFDVGLVCFKRKLMQTGSMTLYDRIFMCLYKIIVLKLNRSLWNMELHIIYIELNHVR